MREEFRQELRELKKEVVDIGRYAIDMTTDAVRALVECDTGVAGRVIDADDELDERVLKVEEDALEMIATQGPVARDLRLLHSLTFISIHMERIGDLAVNISKISCRMQDHEGIQSLYDLIKAQGSLVHRLLEACVEALERYDLELAKKLPEMDEPIDQLFKQFFRELARLDEAGEDVEWASNMVLVARYLERIADHAVDIGERTAYLVTGDFEASFEGTQGQE
jgi:phosphate transport system protein